ncbi:MAG: ferritin family protein [Anaerolineae bacterium]|nr:ferritin family protein [Anaerolineae bacterium]
MAFLKANDIVELAMQLEQNGEAYYRAVAQKAKTPEVQALFEDLAEQEVMHYKIFFKLSQSVKESPMMTDEEWDEYMKYLEATVQSAFFEGTDKALAAAEEAADEKEAVRKALSFEKETLLFFYDLRDTVPAGHREFVEKVADEEKKHIRRLAKML